MEKYGCGYSGVWNICPYVSLEDLILSVYHRYYLQVGLCAVAYCYYYGVDYTLEQVKDL